MPRDDSNEPSAADRAISFVMKHEGGYVFNKKDRGGETIYGIARKHHPKTWAKADAEGRRPTKEEARQIYKTEYWKNIDGDALAAVDPRLALAVLDFAVNSGSGSAIRNLQAVTGVQSANARGADLVRAVLSKGVDQTLEAYHNQRERRYHDIVARDPEQRAFIKGWMNRLNDLRRATAPSQRRQSKPSTTSGR